MIRVAFCFVVIALAGCAEALEGPRFVPIHENRFYLRAALTSSAPFVDDIAQSECEPKGLRAERVSEEQFFPADLRYITYTCVPS